MLDQRQREIHGGSRASGGDDLVIDHDGVGAQFDRIQFERLQGAGIGGGLVFFEQSGPGQHLGGGADGGGVAALLAMAPQQFDDSGVVAQMVGAGESAGQYDQVEVVVDHRVDGGVGDQHRLARGDDRPVGQSGGDDFDFGASQQVDNGDGFEFFTTLSKGDEHSGHVCSSFSVT